MRAEELLPVAGEQSLAALAEPGAVLLQAGQHHLVAFTEMGPAEPRSIAPAGVLSLLRRSR